MIFPTIFFFCLSLGLAVGALFKYLRHPPSVFFTFVIVTSIYIPISIIFLLPIDILSSNDETNKSFFYLNPKYILGLWRFNYWSSFLLMWLVLPFLQEYYRSGEFTQMNKIKDSIKRNLRFYLIVGSIGTVGLIYYFFKFGLHFQTFQNLLIALSHTYSLLLSLWLMSHGLINIPKRRWLNNINLDHQLDELYLSLPKIYEELNESTFNLKDICSTIYSLEKIHGIKESIFKDELNILIGKLPADLEFKNHIRSVDYTNLQQLNDSIFAKLHSTLKNEETNYRSSLYEFNKIKIKILNLKDIIESKSNNFLTFNYSKNYIKNGTLNFYLNVYLLPILNLLLAAVLFLLSIIIIESELFHSTKLSIINLILLSTKIPINLKFLISFILIAYMSLSSLISLTRIKIFKIYHLFPIFSNPVSIVFFTMYSNRLTVPLSYNFLTLLESGKIHSQFNEFLGKSINLSILGNVFNENLPRLILIPILLTSFNIFDKIKKKFSFDSFEEEEENDENKRDLLIKEGKTIIQRAIGKPIRNEELQDDELINEQDLENSSFFNKTINFFNKNRYQDDEV